MVAWILNNGQIILFVVQLLFWIVVGTAALWAAITFNRLVKFTIGGASAPEAAEKNVSVDEFVE